MIDAVHTKPETANSKDDLEALYIQLFGPPALDAAEDETGERDELDKYVLVRKIAEENPRLAQKATRDGTRAHYRGNVPFCYSINSRRERGEASE